MATLKFPIRILDWQRLLRKRQNKRRVSYRDSSSPEIILTIAFFFFCSSSLSPSSPSLFTSSPPLSSSGFIAVGNKLKVLQGTLPPPTGLEFGTADLCWVGQHRCVDACVKLVEQSTVLVRTLHRHSAPFAIRIFAIFQMYFALLLLVLVFALDSCTKVQSS